MVSFARRSARRFAHGRIVAIDTGAALASLVHAVAARDIGRPLAIPFRRPIPAILPYARR
jgi:hypothetical protein